MSARAKLLAGAYGERIYETGISELIPWYMLIAQNIRVKRFTIPSFYSYNVRFKSLIRWHISCQMTQ